MKATPPQRGAASRTPRRKAVARSAIELPDPLDKPKTAILDAAEALFGEQGFASVSVRDIAEAAKANVAAVNYHFGSKERLFEALFARRVMPVNVRRLALLAAARAAAPDGAAGIHAIVDAFVRPALELGDKATHGRRGLLMMRFLSRVLAMPREHLFMDAYYGDVRSSFIGALRLAMPTASEATVLWRYHLMVGALIYAMAGPQRMLRPPDAPPPSARDWDLDDAVRQVVRFCEAGVGAADAEAPATPRKPPGATS